MKGFLQLIWPILQNSEGKFHGAHLWAVCDVQASLAEPDVDEESDAHQESDGGDGGENWYPKILDPPMERGTGSVDQPATQKI